MSRRRSKKIDARKRVVQFRVTDEEMAQLEDLTQRLNKNTGLELFPCNVAKAIVFQAIKRGFDLPILTIGKKT